MLSISEAHFAQLNTLTKTQLSALIVSFAIAFPFVVDVMVNETDYHQMIADIEELAGDGHPAEVESYDNVDHSWSEYHPKTSIVYTRQGLKTSIRIGFTNANDALQFKLKWFGNA